MGKTMLLTGFGLAASLLAATAQAGQDVWTAAGPAGQDVRALAVDHRSILFLYAGTAGAGVFVSGDGTSWAAPNVGLTNLSVTSLAVQPFDIPCPDPCTVPALVYAGTGGGGVFKSGDGGHHWTPVNSGLGDLSVSGLATSSTAVYAATPAGLFVMTGGATTWSTVGNSLPELVSVVEIDPIHPTTLYAGTYGLPGGSVYRSTDAGATWTPASTGFPASGGVLALAVDPARTSTIYASVEITIGCPPPCLHPPGAAFHVYKSVDSGLSWSLADSGLPFSTASLEVDPDHPETIYAAGSGGVFRSVNGGASWSGQNAGLADTNVRTLALDSRTPSTVYIGTQSSGVFARDFSASGGCDAQTLCLVDGRFQVQVVWESEQGLRAAQATPVTRSAGSFWFLTPDNLELTVKILDGRSVNGKWWFFSGALTNLQYRIVVTDTVTLATRTYFNPQGQLASIVDTSAF